LIRLLVVLGVLLSSGARARTLTVGPGMAFAVPSAAASVARDGDRVEIQPGTYIDCAVWTAGHLVIAGVGDAAGVIVADKTCQGKALFITVGDDITVENMTLRGARVPDANGAGIRAEGRGLSVVGVRFLANQNGILSGPVRGTIAIRNSVFVGNGTCDKACAHGVYIGAVDLLRIENSRFEGTLQGHHIKSRALRTEILGCSIDDGDAGTASYAIDIPNGGDVVIRGNSLRKGPRSENRRAMIAIGEEGALHPTSAIVIEGNSARNDSGGVPAFVDNRTGAPVTLRDNRLDGAFQLSP
jgi:hypothetical protein